MILRYIKIGYSINVMRQTACMIVNPLTVNNFSSIQGGTSGTPLDRAAEAPTYITITNCYVRGYVETYTA